jgi:hypothetical protein
MRAVLLNSCTFMAQILAAGFSRKHQDGRAAFRRVGIGGEERLFASFTNLKISAIAVPDSPL